jgi:DNA-directed RNA polymerase specialized sigma24 family protein
VFDGFLGKATESLLNSVPFALFCGNLFGMLRKPPTQEAFDKLLDWLDPDREQAGKKYQKIHARLILIFSNHGCSDPEILADETIDRVIAKIDWLKENYEGDPTRFFYGVARNILKEDLKRRNTHEPLTEYQQIERDEDQTRYDCLDKCMAELPAQSQSVILAYYEEQGVAKIRRRKRLAEERGITVTALRLRVFHMREQLSRCMEECVQRAS